MQRVEFTETRQSSTPLLEQFIFGKGATDGVQYVIYTGVPYLQAKISDSLEVETDSFVVQCSGLVFYEITIFESEPETYEELRELMQEAANAYNEQRSAKQMH